MRFDFTAALQFLTALEGHLTMEAVLDHPAYQAVFLHGQRFGNSLMSGDVRQALAGGPSPFYGLIQLNENLHRIHALLDMLRARQLEWASLASAELNLLLPDENLNNIIIYPIIGYDMGIGLGSSICMNLNTPQYLDEPFEFLYFIIHEAAHILYERSHQVPAIAQVITPRDWQQYFSLWVQNEGFAVYAPYRLRIANHQLVDRDYQVIEDPHRLTSRCKPLLSFTSSWMAQSRSQWMTHSKPFFGRQRVTYQAGCYILQLHRTNGWAARRPGGFLCLCR